MRARGVVVRPSAEIGAGLAPARVARPISAAERIHVVGAAGAGASAAALLALQAGAAVTGCDRGGRSPYTAAVEAAGIPLAWEHRAGHVAVGDRPLVDRVAVTKALTSIDPGHPELAAARRAGIALEPWHQVVADAAATTGQRLVAITGTHGKSTSTGWLVHLLVRAGRDPSAFVGALMDPALTGGVRATARWGSGDAFVVEADEYAGNFEPFRPTLIGLLDAEWDHPDVFADTEAVLAAFEGWIAQAAAGEGAVLVANVGDAGAARLVERLAARPGLRIVRVEPDEPGAGSPMPALRLAGRHNLANAVVVRGLARELGLPEADIADGLTTFSGVGRRMEVKGEPAGVTVLDDYAHHPSAIRATLEAVRERYPGRRVWAVYEPLTYHRTAAMLDAFAQVLATADRAVVADVWAGRDPDTTITSAAALARAITRRASSPAVAPGSVEATADYLSTEVAPGDVVLVMGGGRSYVIAERLVGALSEPSQVDS